MRTTTTLLAVVVMVVLAGCGGGNRGSIVSMETGPGTAPTAEEVMLGTVARVESATMALASD